MIKKRIFVLLAVLFLLCCVIVLPASAYEVWNVFDHIDEITLEGDIAHITFVLPENNVSWGFYENGEFEYLYGQNVKYLATAGEAFNVYFNPFGPVHSAEPVVGAEFYNNMISTDDLPQDTTFNHVVKIGISNGASISYSSVYTALYYTSSDNLLTKYQFFNRNVEWDSEVFNLWIRSSNVPIDVSAGDGFHIQTLISGLTLPYSGSTNFAYEFSISFDVSKAYLDYVTTGRYSAVLDAIEDQLVTNGQTLSGIMEQQQQTNQSLEDIIDSQQQTNEKLDNIINSEITGEPPEGFHVFEDYEAAEDDLMDSVSGGMDEFENITMTAWDRIYAYSQSFLAFSFLFGLFADIPIFQSLLYISLTLGTFAFLLGLGTQAARYFDRHHTAAGKRRGG